MLDHQRVPHGKSPSPELLQEVIPLDEVNTEERLGQSWESLGCYPNIRKTK